MDAILFAYFGPEAMLPLTSVVATVAGLCMILGRNTTRFLRWALWERLIGMGRNRPVPGPHFHVGARNRSYSAVDPGHEG